MLPGTGQAGRAAPVGARPARSACAPAAALPASSASGSTSNRRRAGERRPRSGQADDRALLMEISFPRSKKASGGGTHGKRETCAYALGLGKPAGKAAGPEVRRREMGRGDEEEP